LNSELPVNSRIHVVEEFNKNIYDIIIASDEHEVIGDEETDSKAKENYKTNSQEENTTTDVSQNVINGDQNGTNESTNGENSEPPLSKTEEVPVKKKRKAVDRDRDYGVARGIDFKNVACVLNFDLPTSSRSYIHRIGRTARAGKSGMALSFVIPKEKYRKHKPTSIRSTERDEEVLAKIVRHQEKKGNKVEPYAFDMQKLEGFRYRLQDALRAVTSGAIREARVRELRQELVKSEKLKRHFEENPDDFRHLRHDGDLRAAKVKAHMRHVPDYLVPGGPKTTAEDIGFVPFRNPDKEGKRRKGSGGYRPRRGRGGKINPLQSFKSKRR